MENFKKKIGLAQEFLAAKGWDGWLLYDFKRLNPLACHFLEIPEATHLTRRFFYWIPQRGEPVKIVSAVENHLEHLPGSTRRYETWKSLHDELQAILKKSATIAMEYSPMGATPEVSKVDGGTLELIKSFGAAVVSSGDLYQSVTCICDDEQYQGHIRAAKVLEDAAAHAWDYIRKNLGKVTEWDVQQFILHKIEKRGCVTEGAPIVGVNAHSADPHYSPEKGSALKINPGDFVLIDLWCKEDAPRSIYADITRVGFAGDPSDQHKKIFSIVKDAQDAATELVKERFKNKKTIYGWEVDEAAREVILDAGFGKYFIHRTGHNIHENTHGPGVHNDNFETQDKRELLKGTCCSIEPGIYLPGKFGVRLEYDLFIHEDGKVEITGGIQNEIERLI